MIRILRWPIRMAALAVALLALTSETGLAGGPGGGYGGGGIGGGFYSGSGSGRGLYGASNGYGGAYGAGATPYWTVGPTYSPYANLGYQAGPYYYHSGFSSPFVTNSSTQQDDPMGWDPFAKAPPDVPARIKVEVPDANATLTFDGAKTTTTGTVREFRTAPLKAGRYTYEIQASWMQNGHMTTKTQKVQVTPGAQSIVNFLPG